MFHGNYNIIRWSNIGGLLYISHAFYDYIRCNFISISYIFYIILIVLYCIAGLHFVKYCVKKLYILQYTCNIYTIVTRELSRNQSAHEYTTSETKKVVYWRQRYGFSIFSIARANCYRNYAEKNAVSHGRNYARLEIIAAVRTTD